MTTHYADRLQSLYAADFGEWREFAIRHSALLIAAVVGYAVTRDNFIPAWGAMAYAVIGSYWAYLIAGPRQLLNSRTGFAIAIILYCAQILSFSVIGLFFILEGSHAYLVCGVVMLCAVATYMLHRPHSTPETVAANSFIAVIVAAVIVYRLCHSISDRALCLWAAISVVLFVLYFIHALYTSHHRQLMRETAEQKAAQAQKTRALSQFVGGVAHNFNNQLTAVLGHLELAQVLHCPEERRKALEQSHNAAAQAAVTVRRLLASSGRALLQPTHFPVSELLDGLAQSLPNLLDKTMTIDIVDAAEDLYVFADRTMLETSITELCLNAQDATKGTGTIFIKSTIFPPQNRSENAPVSHGTRCLITVQDDGPGVAQDVLPMLTEPFFTTKGLGDGPGLGLSSVAGFARQSCGSLTIEASLFGGLCVQIALPVQANTARAVRPA